MPKRHETANANQMVTMLKRRKKYCDSIDEDAQTDKKPCQSLSPADEQ